MSGDWSAICQGLELSSTTTVSRTTIIDHPQQHARQQSLTERRVPVENNKTVVALALTGGRHALELVAEHPTRAVKERHVLDSSQAAGR